MSDCVPGRANAISQIQEARNRHGDGPGQEGGGRAAGGSVGGGRRPGRHGRPIVSLFHSRFFATWGFDGRLATFAESKDTMGGCGTVVAAGGGRRRRQARRRARPGAGGDRLHRLRRTTAPTDRIAALSYFLLTPLSQCLPVKPKPWAAPPRSHCSRAMQS